MNKTDKAEMVTRKREVIDPEGYEGSFSSLYRMSQEVIVDTGGRVAKAPNLDEQDEGLDDEEY